MFKKCPCCKHSWSTREEFLSDPLVKIIGYQVNFAHLEAGVFLFNHLPSQCHTTISLNVECFSDLYDGEIFQERLEGLKECPGYCLQRANLKDCPAKCECNYVRKVIQLILKHPKTHHHHPASHPH